MGQFSASMLAEIKSGSREIYTIVDLLFGGLNTRRYAALPIKSESLGQYNGRISSLGQFDRSVSDVEGKIIYPRLGNITIEDRDGDLAEILEMVEPGTQPVTVRLASPNVSMANWYTITDNFFLDDWSQESSLIWTLSFAYNDMPLRSLFPKALILRPDFPNVADPIIYTYHVMIPYGIHDSRGVGDKGMVQTFYLDTALGWFGGWLGWITVDRVYMDGVIQSSGWTTLHPIINGRQYTLIVFTTPPSAEIVVTADITGYKDGTDGTGNLITGVNTIKHALVNFIYPTEEWRKGAWFADSTAPVNTTHFAEMQTFLTGLGWEKISKLIGGTKRMKGEDALNEICASLGKIGSIGSFITADGKISVRPNSHMTTTLFYSGTRWIRYDSDELGENGSYGLSRDRHSLADRVSVQFLRNSVDDQYRWTIEVRDLSITQGAAVDLPLPWSNSQLD